MRKISIALIAVIIIAGCTASQVDLFLKASPLVSSFLEQYPNAKVTTILVAQGTVLAQIEKIREDCGPDFSVSSYYKTTLDDKESGTMLTVWMDSASYQITCAVKETAGVKEEVDANKTIEATTTTIPPTTTIFSTTTLAPTTTSFNATATTSAPATNMTTTTLFNATNTTASGPALPDLIAYVYAYGPPPGTGKINLTGVVENIGTAGSNAGQAKFNLTNEGSGYQWYNLVNVQALAPGNKTTFFPDFSQILTTAGSYTFAINADTGGTTAESNEQNNHGSVSFGVLSNNTTTTSAPNATNATDKPDVVVDVLTIGFGANNRVEVSYRVGNRGNTGTSTGQIFTLYNITGPQNYSGGQHFSSLTGGYSSPSYMIVNGTLPGGNYKVEVFADPTNNILESNEANNNYTQTFTVP